MKNSRINSFLPSEKWVLYYDPSADFGYKWSIETLDENIYYFNSKSSCYGFILNSYLKSLPDQTQIASWLSKADRALFERAVKSNHIIKVRLDKARFPVTYKPQDNYERSYIRLD